MKFKSILYLFLLSTFYAFASLKIDEKLVGTWSNHFLTVQFNQDGTLNMLDGKKRLFTTENGKLKIILENQIVETAYTVRNSMLSLALNGKTILLRKQESTVKGTNDTVKTVLPELAGKWCYISSPSPEAQMSGECVILSQDGQFTFLHDADENKIRSERGEWWANMNSLYFLAQNGHTDTYRITKKKHPSLGYLMLNIDGRNFISADQKTSWQ